MCRTVELAQAEPSHLVRVRVRARARVRVRARARNRVGVKVRVRLSHRTGVARSKLSDAAVAAAE